MEGSLLLTTGGLEPVALALTPRAWLPPLLPSSLSGVSSSKATCSSVRWPLVALELLLRGAVEASEVGGGMVGSGKWWWWWKEGGVEVVVETLVGRAGVQVPSLELVYPPGQSHIVGVLHLSQLTWLWQAPLRLGPAANQDRFGTGLPGLTGDW